MAKKHRNIYRKDWENAYYSIKEKILKRQIKSGQVVTELSLAEQIGYGRTPVREALKKLEQEGLIYTTNRTKRAYLLTVKEIEEIFDIKMCIESAMVKKAIEKGSTEDFIQLDILLYEFKQISENRPKNSDNEKEWMKEWMAKDEELHSHIFKMANNKRAGQLIESLDEQWHKLRLGIVAIEGRIEKSKREHQDFVQAILDKDTKKAAEAMGDYLLNLKKTIVKLMNYFEYPVA